jgi:glycosyltransferase involved in cell wall biosynthesis
MNDPTPPPSMSAPHRNSTDLSAQPSEPPPDDVSPSQCVLINATNLHSGGGVQVAVSFLKEVAALPQNSLRLSVATSSEVAAALDRLGIDCSSFQHFEILNTHAWRGMLRLQKYFHDANAVFTIFGPLYTLRKPRLSIIGFAQAWIIYPENEVYARFTSAKKLATSIIYFLKRIAFQFCSDFIFVEADHVRSGLVSQRIFSRDKIAVIPNCVSELYFQPHKWTNVDIPDGTSDFKFGIVSRDYPHKNLDILPMVKAALREQYEIDADFVVTLDEDEWSLKSENFRKNILNVGPLKVEQCPLFYKQIDGVIFPSQLECFSATPLEAMVMGKPLFASDRAFVRDFCADFPWYFDPNSASDAARIIAEFIRSGGSASRIEAARQHVLSLPDARHRAISYLTNIECILDNRQL